MAASLVGATIAKNLLPRTVKQAIQGLVHLASSKSELRPQVVLKLLQVINDPQRYRTMYAIRGLGSLTYCDEDLIVPSIQILMQMVGPTEIPAARKAALCALSRIGRKYPTFQKVLAPVLQEEAFSGENLSVRWAAIIGLGRLSQTNANLRTHSQEQIIQCITHPHFRMRWAAMKCLGHMACPIGNVPPDESLEELCFTLATALLSHGGAPDLMSSIQITPVPSAGGHPNSYREDLQSSWKRQDVHLVQKGCVQALGLLLRSNPDKWWQSVHPIFGTILDNSNHVDIVKSSVISAYGKMAYYIRPENPIFGPFKQNLVEIATSHEPFSDPAIAALSALTSVSFAHHFLYQEIKRMVADKIGASDLLAASDVSLHHYLKIWCKLLSLDFHPVLNLSTNFIRHQPVAGEATPAPSQPAKPNLRDLPAKTQTSNTAPKGLFREKPDYKKVLGKLPPLEEHGVKRKLEQPPPAQSGQKPVNIIDLPVEPIIPPVKPEPLKGKTTLIKDVKPEPQKSKGTTIIKDIKPEANAPPKKKQKIEKTETPVPATTRITRQQAREVQQTGDDEKAVSPFASLLNSDTAKNSLEISFLDEEMEDLPTPTLQTSVPQTRPKKKKKKSKPAPPRRVCQAWLMRKCHNPLCPNLHEGEQIRYTTICKYFRTGNCTKGEECPYSHDLGSEGCKNLAETGKCTFMNCKYSHSPEKIQKYLEDKKAQETHPQDKA